MKNNYASEYIYNAYKDTKTCGVIEEDKSFGIKKIAEHTVPKIAKDLRKYTFPFSAFKGCRIYPRTPFTRTGISRNVNPRIIYLIAAPSQLNCLPKGSVINRLWFVCVKYCGIPTVGRAFGPSSRRRACGKQPAPSPVVGRSCAAASCRALARTADR